MADAAPLILSALGVAVAWLWAGTRREPEAVAWLDAVPVEGTTQTAGALESAWANVDLSGTFSPWSPMWAAAGGDPATNRRAFLDMIAFAEGTANMPADGYATLFGGGQFDSYADHPRILFSFQNSRGERLKTSAAGRYQFLARTWDELRGPLGLPDFGPDSQDAAALELIRQRGALADVDAGRTLTAINKVRKVWASLPGAGYAQPERHQSALLAAYSAAGGQTVEA